MITRAATLTFALLLFAGCSKPASKASEKAVSYCSDFARELGQAAAKYTEFAGWIAANKLDPEQRKRAESQLLYGATLEQRGWVGLELGRRMHFCGAIRRDSVAQVDATGTSFETFREKDDPQEVAKALSELSEAAKKLSSMPLVD